MEKSILEEYGAVARWNVSLGVTFSSGAKRSGILTLKLLCRGNVCLLPTLRLSTIFSRVLVICMRNHASRGNYLS